MQMPKYAKGSIAFLIVIAVAHNWSAITVVFEPPWEPWPPIVYVMGEYVVPFLHHIYRPILIGLTGLAVFWIWEDRCEGYVVAGLLALVASVFGIGITFFNLMTQEWSAVFTAAVAFSYPAVMALWYSTQGLLNHEYRLA